MMRCTHVKFRKAELRRRRRGRKAIFILLLTLTNKVTETWVCVAARFVLQVLVPSLES